MSTDPEFERRLRSFLDQRMESSARRTTTSWSLGDRRVGNRARFGLVPTGLTAAVVVVALGLAVWLQPAQLTYSSVVAPGLGRIQVASATQGRLVSQFVPGWVTRAALAAPWTGGVNGTKSTRRVRIEHLRITGGFYVAGAKSVRIDTQSSYSSTSPQNLWIVTLAAPPQAGWNSVVASAIINANTRRVMSTSALESVAPTPST